MVSKLFNSTRKLLGTCLMLVPILLQAQPIDTIPATDMDVTAKHLPEDIWTELDLTPKSDVVDPQGNLEWINDTYKDYRKFPWWAFTPLAGVPVVYYLIREEEEPVNPPTIDCQPDEILSWEEAVPSPDIGAINVESDCPEGFEITHEGDLSNEGSGCAGDPLIITRTYRVTDNCGNTTSCQQTFTFLVDEEAPVLDCPPTITLTWGEAVPAPDVSQLTVSDNCTPTNEIILTHLEDMDNGGGPCVDDILEITRTYQAVDACGNTSTCEQILSYLPDEEAPVLGCPPTITLTWGEDVPAPDISQLTVTDNCTPTNEIILTHVEDTDNGGGPCADDLLEIIRTYQAEDICGNTSTCEQLIQFEADTEAPTITCPVDVSVECQQIDDLGVTGQPIAEDDCTPSNEITLSYTDDTSGLNDCGGTGTIIRTWTATDLCGNESTCTQTITVVDLTAPIIVCPPDITVFCGEQDDLAITGVATAEDNCTPPDQITFIYEDDLSGFSGCSGIILRTWTAVDACGNASFCVQTITVEEINCDFTGSWSVIPADCPMPNGSIDVVVDPPGSYSFEWSSGQTDPQILDLPPGNYELTVTDLVGSCSEVYTVVVPENIQSIDLVVENIFPPSLPGQFDGSVELFVPTPTVQFPLIVIMNGSFFGEFFTQAITLDNLGEGTYDIYVVDGQTGCESNPVQVTLISIPFEPAFHQSNLLPGIVPLQPVDLENTIASVLIEHPDVEAEVEAVSMNVYGNAAVGGYVQDRWYLSFGYAALGGNLSGSFSTGDGVSGLWEAPWQSEVVELQVSRLLGDNNLRWLLGLEAGMHNQRIGNTRIQVGENIYSDSGTQNNSEWNIHGVLGLDIQTTNKQATVRIQTDERGYFRLMVLFLL